MRTLNSTCPNFWIQQISSFHTSIVDLERTSACEGRALVTVSSSWAKVVRCTDPLRYYMSTLRMHRKINQVAWCKCVWRTNQYWLYQKVVLGVMFMCLTFTWRSYQQKPLVGTISMCNLVQEFLMTPQSWDNFYVQPCPRVPDDPTKPWFSANPTGKNSLSEGSITVKTKMLL